MSQTRAAQTEVILAAKKGRRIIPLTMAIDDPDPEEQSLAVEYRKLELIGRYRDLHEALLAKAGLESAEIECFLADENIVRMDWLWSNFLGGVKLLVRPEDAGPAAEILGEPPPERFEVAGVGEYEHPRCPQCSSIDIHFEEFTPLAFVTLYLGVPFPLCREGWKCHSCGHLWRADADANANSD
jgi:hypothetical protein